MRIHRFLFVLIVWGALPGQAQNIIHERVSQLKRLVPLERLTFGPEDSYQPVPLNAGEVLFTQKTHMNPELQILDLKTRERRPWGIDLRDNDQAQVSPDGSQIVFRSLNQNPDGSLCVLELRGRTPRCLPLENGEKTSPFWISNDEIAYLRKPRHSGQFVLESWNIRNNQGKSLGVEGIFHPSAVTGRITWVEKGDRQNRPQRLQYADLTNSGLGPRCSLDLTWPGLSASPRLSKDGRTVFFSHYLSDTNQDGRIDGDDHSILARLPLPASGCPTGPLTPAPLTSLHENCSQPALLPNSPEEGLILSCAFEGSLDLYRLPTTGMIPSTWTDTDLLQAHTSARTPEDRLLFLLALQNRHPEPRLLEGLFAQHLLMDDESGALNWLGQIPLQTEGLSGPDRRIWIPLLEAGRERKNEPAGELSLALRQSLEAHLRQIKGTDLLARSARARIDRLMGNLKNAKNELEAAARLRPLKANDLNFLLFSREWDLLSEKIPLNENLAAEALAANPRLLPESQLIFWSKLLARIPPSEPVSKATSQIQSWLKKLPLSAQVRTLLQLELLARRVAAGEKDAYVEFDRLLSEQRSQALLVRLSAYRAIRLWTAADRLQEVEFITSNLLKFLPPQTLEWTYGRDYFIATAFDRAYELVGEQKPAAALGHFYGAVTLTDDLEAHWGYLTNMVAAGREAQINRQIDELKKRRFLDRNENLVRLYAELARRHGALPPQPEEWLRKAAQAQTLPDAFADFLRGSVRLQWVMSSPSMPAEQKHLELEKARLELVQALDGARENQRLRAQVLTNLGVLGDQAGLWGPAQKWWAERLSLPFSMPEEREFALYLRARALAGLQDFQAADLVLSELRAPPALLQAPIRHLRIVAAAYSGQHAKVLQWAGTVPPDLKTRNDLKVALLVGRSLLATGQNEKACPLFAQIDRALQAQPVPRLENPPSGSSPQRWRILNAGFWAQCGSPEGLALQKKLLQIGVDERKQLAFEELNFLELRMKNQVREWILQGKLTPASIDAYLADLDAHRTAAGEFVHLSQFEALYALGALALISPIKPTPEQLSLLKGRMESFINSASRSTTRSDLLISQRLRLDALKMKLEGRPNRELEQALLRSQELLELESRNQLLAEKTKKSIFFNGDPEKAPERSKN